MTTEPGRASLFAIVRALPDTGLDIIVRTTRVTASALHVAGAATATGLDVATRPAPVQASLNVIAMRLEPSRARGADVRREQAVALAMFGRAVGDATRSLVMAVMQRLPINEILSQIDLNSLLANVDLNRLLTNVDLNGLLANIDLGPVINSALEQIDIGAVMRESTSGVTDEMRDLGRVGAMNGDALVARIIDRILRRHEPRLDVVASTP
jgi:hypothetical protein